MPLDFHTHFSAPPLRCDAVYSLSLGEAVPWSDDAHAASIPLHTVGLHPWDTGQDRASDLIRSQLPARLTAPGCVGLGEVGLDRLRGAPLTVQREFLARQLRHARESHRPVVLHCVRAFSELLATIRSAKLDQPVALHAFRGGGQILNQALAQGFYLSVGPDAQGRLPEIAREIPTDRLLLETDCSNRSIDELLEQLARMRACAPGELRESIQTNTVRFYQL